VIGNSIYAQTSLKVDAGKDTNYCFRVQQDYYEFVPEYQNRFTLGGTPTIIGGKSPYEISWKMYSKTNGQLFTLLTDSGIQNELNPKVVLPYFDPFLTKTDTLSEDPLNDIFIFKITVKDSNQIIISDSCEIGISRYFEINSMMYVDNPNFLLKIKSDSIQLPRHGPIGGIAPFKYHWTPEVGLSNPFIGSPMAKPLVATVYRLDITDNIGCKSGDIAVFTKTDIIDNGYVYFQNPLKDESQMYFSSEFLGSTFQLHSENGINLYQTTLKTLSLPIGILIKTTGIYFYTIISQQGKVITGKFIKE